MVYYCGNNELSHRLQTNGGRDVLGTHNACLKKRVRARLQPEASGCAPICSELDWGLQAPRRPTPVAQRRAHATWVSARDFEPIHAEGIRVRKHAIGEAIDEKWAREERNARAPIEIASNATLAESVSGLPFLCIARLEITAEDVQI